MKILRPCLLLFLVCLTSAAEAQSMFRGNSAHSGVYAGPAPRKFHRVKWKFPTEGERRFEAKGLHGWQPKSQTFADAFDVFLSSPAVEDGAVYFGSGDGNLYSLDANSGELRWKFKTGDVVHASPAIA